MTDGPGGFTIEHGALEYPARCNLGDLGIIEDRCGRDAGDGSRLPRPVGVIRNALLDGSYSQADATEPLRVALIGGGMATGRARQLVAELQERDGLEIAALLSLAVLQIAFSGVPRKIEDAPDEDESVKKNPSAPRRSRSRKSASA